MKEKRGRENRARRQEPGGQEDSNSFQEAELLFVYTRQQALADGVLVDVSAPAREVGFRFPVALTANLWADINAIPEAEKGIQDINGRLWHLLWMARVAIATQQSAGEGSTLLYRLSLPVAGGGERSGAFYTVKLVRGPGDNLEPVMTLMRPDED